MWIASKLGFYSMVQKSAGEWHIRARLRRDLEQLAQATDLDPAEIQCWEHTDYRWRIICRDPVKMAEVFLGLFASVTYGNFKSEVARHPDQQGKLPAYHHLWSELESLQEKNRRNPS